MCGITGILGDFKKSSIKNILYKMSNSLYHRGPDNQGLWVDDKIAFGHQRLSILDLSQSANQPMFSKSNRFVITFNGEIYNHLDLRKELKFSEWRGTSDTETLLVCIEEWGIGLCLRKLRGMFAFALWDKKEKALFLARDRAGEKPLYYGYVNNLFIFCSEIKALKKISEFNMNINREALDLYMRLGYVPTPLSIFKNVFKLLPGSYLKLDLKTYKKKICTPKKYWDIDQVISLQKIKKDESDVIEELDFLLKRTVKEQMISDVPIGAFLSSGIDSSTIVSLMQFQSSKPIKTFSIGFWEKDYDEAKDAKVISNYLATDHQELYVDQKDALNQIENLSLIFDEPFADSSNIPTVILSNLAKQKVTVALSGDGGDELFGGYNRYKIANQLNFILNNVPIKLKNLIIKILLEISPHHWDVLYKTFCNLLFKEKHINSFGDKLHKLLDILKANDSKSLYKSFLFQQREIESLVLGQKNNLEFINFDNNFNVNRNYIEKMMLSDFKGYLTDDILTKVDRSAMSVSLETRVPYLNHQVVEFAWSLPFHQKIRNGNRKWILKEVLKKYLPQKLSLRPKQGFSIPIEKWLREELRDWAESLIEKKKINEDGFLDYQIIKTKWDEHLSKKRNWQHWLWNVLVFQSWLENN